MLVQILKLLLFGQSEYNVFGLQIGVDDTAHAVHVIQAEEELAGESPDNWNRNATVVVLPHQAQEILAEDLHRHRVVLAVEGMMEELVEHLQIVGVIAGRFKLWILEVRAQELGPFRVPEVLGHFIEYFLFFESRINILLCALLNLEGIELLI